MATTRAAGTLVAPRASTSERKQAAQQIGATVAAEISREALRTTRAVARSPRRRREYAEAAKNVAKVAGPIIARVLPVAGAVAAGGAAAVAVHGSVKQQAEARVREVERTLRTKLDPKTRKTLLKQHIDYIYRQGRIKGTEASRAGR